MNTRINFNEKIILALDFQNLTETQRFLEPFLDSSHAALRGKDLKKYTPKFVKVGLELFYARGEDIIEYLQKKKLKIFLDLKIHDIPNTAYGAIKSLSNIGIDMINVHAFGGIEMMQAAKKALAESHNKSKTKILGVTLLTSIDQTTMNREFGIDESSENFVLRLAKNVKQAKLDGVVCSSLEAPMLRQEFGEHFITVCPGIVPVSSKTKNDQKRITSPEEAFANGADYIVVGRAITQAKNPLNIFVETLDGLYKEQDPNSTNQIQIPVSIKK